MNEEMKMSELFPFAFQVEHNKSFEVQDVTWYSYGEKYESDSYQDSAIERAVLNHDRLTEENRKLREALKLITDQTEKYTAKTKGKGVKVREIREHDLLSAKQLLKELK